MAVQRVKGKYLVFVGDGQAEAKYRKELSELIIDQFGKGPFSNFDDTRPIITFSLNYFISNFQKVCHSEKSILFYQRILELHEFSVELTAYYQHEDISKDVTVAYMAAYRRILKYIIETACEVEMHSKEERSRDFYQRTDDVINDLLFLGNMIITCVELYAEQAMVPDVAYLSFDEESLYTFSRKDRYEQVVRRILETFEDDFAAAVNEAEALEDFKVVLQDSFSISYDQVGHLIASVHQQLEPQGGQYIGIPWIDYPTNLSEMLNIPFETASQFFSGLTLDKGNKMDLLTLACKPYALNRYLYRPIVIWNVDGNDFAFLCSAAWTESIVQLASNAVPWGKAPSEWLTNKLFQEYVFEKERQHDKWLEDPLEQTVQQMNLMYDRNLKSLRANNGFVSINVQDLGEIDFVVIVPTLSTVYLIDCKHLLARYDMVNQKNDYNAFVTNKKSYNSTLTKKVNWFMDNIGIVEQHYVRKYGDRQVSLEGYSVEGIFVVNTPTIYMYNSEYRIYRVGQIEDVFSGQYKDFSIIIVDVEGGVVETINYPYFEIPVEVLDSLV